MSLKIDPTIASKNAKSLVSTKSVSNLLKKTEPMKLDMVDISSVAKEAKKKDFSKLSFTEKIALVMNSNK